MEMSHGKEGARLTLSSRPLHVGIFTPLPAIEGVTPLSASDIIDDLKEIEKNLYDGEDSDGSVMSDDILIAKFPVKPRKSFKIPNNLPAVQPMQQLSDDEKEPVVEETLEQAMMFLNSVESTYKEIAEAERKREALDITYQAIKDAYLLRVSRFGDAQKQYGNYFRALQGLTARAVQVYTLYNRRNAILCDIFESLCRRKSVIAQTDSAPEANLRPDEVLEYRVTINAAPVQVQVPTVGREEQEKTASVTVTATPIPVNITLYKGQYIDTVMGEGVVKHIFPAEMKLIVLLLGFGGVLYLNIKTYLAYVLKKFGSQETLSSEGALSRLLDLSSSESMLARWRGYEKQLHLSDAKESRIHAILTGVNLPTQIPGQPVVNITTSEAPAAHFSSALRAILGRNSICVAVNEPEAETSESDDEHEGLSRNSSSDTESVTASSDQSDIKKGKTSSVGTGVGPSEVDDEAVVARESTRFHNLARGVLPLVYTPVSSMSNVVDAMIDGNTGRGSASTRQAMVNICQRAFSAKTMCGLEVSTDLTFLQKSLQRLYKEVHDVEEHQTAMMREIERVSADTAQLMGCTMRERLHLLNSRGLIPGPFGLLRGSRSSKSSRVTNAPSDSSLSEMAGVLNRGDIESSGVSESEGEGDVEDVPVVPVSTRSSANRGTATSSTSASAGIAVIRREEKSPVEPGVEVVTSTKFTAGKPPNGRIPPTTALTNISTENITSGPRNAKRGAAEISKYGTAASVTAKEEKNSSVDDDSDFSSQRRIRTRK